MGDVEAMSAGAVRVWPIVPLMVVALGTASVASAAAPPTSLSSAGANGPPPLPDDLKDGFARCTPLGEEDRAACRARHRILAALLDDSELAGKHLSCRYSVRLLRPPGEPARTDVQQASCDLGDPALAGHVGELIGRIRFDPVAPARLRLSIALSTELPRLQPPDGETDEASWRQRGARTGRVEARFSESDYSWSPVSGPPPGCPTGCLVSARPSPAARARSDADAKAAALLDAAWRRDLPGQVMAALKHDRELHALLKTGRFSFGLYVSVSPTFREQVSVSVDRTAGSAVGLDDRLQATIRADLLARKTEVFGALPSWGGSTYLEIGRN